MTTRARICLVALLFGAIAFSAVAQGGAGATPGKPVSWWLPELASEHGRSIDRLFVTIFWVTGVTFVLVEVTLLVFLVRFRKRPGGTARYTHGNNTLEIVWTIIPLIILVVLTFLSRGVWAELKAGLYEDLPRDARAFQVRIDAQQFQWNITYPGADGRIGTSDDVTAINQLHLPLNRDVVVKLKSNDVIHSFFLPEFRVKQDALPNATARVRFRPVKEGEWEILCAELCGLGHYRMRGFVVVESQQAVDKWLAGQKASAEGQ